MVVYADVLLVLNFIVDYFLILASLRICCLKQRPLRLIFGAMVGAVSSLYIFLPPINLFGEILYKLFVSLLIVITVFGVKSVKSLLKGFLIFFLITCCYGGVMTVIFKTLEPNGMVIFNSVVYFNISPTALVFTTTAAYLLFILLGKIFSKASKTARKCNIRVSAANKQVEFKGILDTGNSLEDIMGRSEIIIADKSVLRELFGELNPDINTEIKPRFRMVPLNTVSGSDVLEGLRCDNAEVFAEGRCITLEKPILAVSKVSLSDDYKGILNPKIFE